MDDYLPARMINEFTYCPRLFYYEHVEGVFAHNVETIEGEIAHSRVDRKAEEFPPAEALVDSTETLRSRSVTLSSESHRVIAKMDLVEAAEGEVVPVDYKRGRPRESEDGTLEAWETDQIRLGVQALVLRDNGYVCNRAVVYYATTKQRVQLEVDEALIRRTLTAIEGARITMTAVEIPAPLVDSPKCPRCSLVGICLPDETWACQASPAIDSPVQQTLFDTGPFPITRDGFERDNDQPVRRLVPARDDLRPLYLNKQGLTVGKIGRSPYRSGTKSSSFKRSACTRSVK